MPCSKFLPFLLLLGVNLSVTFFFSQSLLKPFYSDFSLHWSIQLALGNGTNDSWFTQLTGFFAILSVSYFFGGLLFLSLPLGVLVPPRGLSWLFFSTFALSSSPVITTTTHISITLKYKIQIQLSFYWLLSLSCSSGSCDSSCPHAIILFLSALFSLRFPFLPSWFQSQNIGNHLCSFVVPISSPLFKS